MDFAKKQLLKYGWKEGEGLGKDGNQGIATALKPKYKLGKEGMGFDMSKELVDTWWTRSYQDSLSRINISTATSESETSSGHGVMGEGNDGVKVTFVQDESGGDEMSKMRRRMMKSNFQEFSKGAVLDNGMMVEDNNSDSETDSGIDTPGSSTSTSSKLMSDEELFKACGGRTAHKAARFGHKLSGKLARVAAQEQAELEAFQQLQRSTTLPTNHRNQNEVVKQRKSKRSHSVEIDQESSSDIKQKKRRKKRCTDFVDESAECSSSAIGTADAVVEEMDHEPSFDEGKEEKRQKRKKKSKSKYSQQ